MRSLLAKLPGIGQYFETEPERARRLRAQLADLDSWIDLLDRLLVDYRARRQAIQLELFGGDTPDTRARLAEGQ